MSEPRRDEYGRVLCASLTKRGEPCGAVAREGGYCVEHQVAESVSADLVHLGFSRQQVQLVREAERIKGLLGTEGLTLAQVRACVPGLSKKALADLEQNLRRDPDLMESVERRPDALGRERDQVVLRVR